MITVQRLDGAAAAAAEGAFRLVYAEAFAEPPYDKGSEDVETNMRRFRSQTRKASFRAALAVDADVPVGIAYGYALSAATSWWDIVEPSVPDDVRREDGHRTFGLIELAVRSAWRRQGVAARLHAAIVDGMPEQRVLLNTRPDAEAAQAAYRSWGYRRIGTGRPWAGAVVHDVMLRERPAG